MLFYKRWFRRKSKSFSEVSSPNSNNSNGELVKRKSSLHRLRGSGSTSSPISNLIVYRLSGYCSPSSSKAFSSKGAALIREECSRARAVTDLLIEARTAVSVKTLTQPQIRLHGTSLLHCLYRMVSRVEMRTSLVSSKGDRDDRASLNSR